MKKENAIRYYRKFSGADAYILGFNYKKDFYMISVEEIMPRYIRVERASSKKGGGEKLQFRLKNCHKEQLIRKGATKVDFAPKTNNKGREFEQFIYERNGQEFRGADHVGFYAQDVESADKWNCMFGEMNGYKTLGYTELIAPLVAYCQHLEKRIKELEDKK